MGRVIVDGGNREPAPPSAPSGSRQSQQQLDVSDGGADLRIHTGIGGTANEVQPMR